MSFINYIIFSISQKHVIWSVRGPHDYKKATLSLSKPHTYLDGISPFMYLGLWAVEMLHSTATLSSEGVCGLYMLRHMHRLNIFLSCFGHSGWAGSLFFRLFRVLTLTLWQ
jgi:hypothetical protein